MKNLLLIFLALSFTACFSSPPKEEPVPIPVETDEATAQKLKEVANTALKPEMHSTSQQDSKMVWSYQGVLGPDSWGDISPEYSLCKTGKNQSPVHLIWSRPKQGRSLSFNYKHSNLTMLDTGHTIQVNVEKGNIATLHGKAYELQQIHFHSSAEHSLSGNILPIEVHLVHKNPQGELAVVAYFAIEGQAHDVISELWSFMPQKKNQEVSVNKLIDPLTLLPKKFHHYHYNGSLTTPPCTEGVKWFVLNTPVTFSKDQILLFRQAYSVNNRPIQPLNSRKLINY